MTISNLTSYQYLVFYSILFLMKMHFLVKHIGLESENNLRKIFDQFYKRYDCKILINVQYTFVKTSYNRFIM